MNEFHLIICKYFACLPAFYNTISKQQVMHQAYQTPPK